MNVTCEVCLTVIENVDKIEDKHKHICCPNCGQMYNAEIVKFFLEKKNAKKGNG